MKNLQIYQTIDGEYLDPLNSILSNIGFQFYSVSCPCNLDGVYSQWLCTLWEVTEMEWREQITFGYASIEHRMLTDEEIEFWLPYFIELGYSNDHTN